MGVTVLGVDPGVTTGVAWFNDEKFSLKDSDGGGHAQIRASRSVRGERDVARQLCVIVERVNPDLVCVEDFVLGHGRMKMHSSGRDGLSPVRITSMFFVWLWDVMEWDGSVTMQSASDAKRVCTDARLRVKGLWIPGQVHARDAARHAWLGYKRLRAGNVKLVRV